MTHRLNPSHSRLPVVSEAFWEKADQRLAEWKSAGLACKGDFDALRATHADINDIAVYRDAQDQLYVQIVLHDSATIDRSLLPAQIQGFSVQVVNNQSRRPPHRFPEPGPE
jgi:hypothetical protein